jgi:putative ABC transport system permease protein
MKWKPRQEREKELAEEVAFHLEGRTQEHIARGMSPEDAARAARLEFGGVERSKEECRDARGFWERCDQVLRLIRHAARRLAATPGFTAISVATLAIGIGASAAVFSLVNGILLRPLGLWEPQRLVTVSQELAKAGKRSRVPVSAAHMREWRANSRSLESISLMNGDRRFLAPPDGGGPIPVFAVNVSADFFRMLPAQPALGRVFAAGDDEAGKNDLAILSYQMWRDRFGSDPGVLGQRMSLAGGESLEIVGVLPAEFSFPLGNDLNLGVGLPPRADYWRPLALARSQLNPLAEFNYLAVARVRPGFTLEAAEQEWSGLSRNLVKSAGGSFDVSVKAVAIADAIWGGVNQPLQLLSMAVGAVLLICCLNVSNLVLARLLARRHEHALRTSLGASRARLLWEMLSEGALLVAGGGALGLLWAGWLMSVLPGWVSLPLPQSANLAFDWRVALFAVGVCGLATVLAAAIPAWRFATTDPNDVMRSSGATRTSTSSRATIRLRSVLVAAEVGICVLLLVCAGLLLRSFGQLMNVDRGFDAAQATVFEAQLPADRYAREVERLPMWRTIFERLAALPGVSAVGAVNRLPMAPERGINGVLAEGEPARPVTEQPLANYRAATTGYFAAAGIGLRKGRIFDESAADSTGVVISENLARRVWPGQDPVGRRFRRNGEGDWFTVLGVVADVKQVNLEAAAPMMVYQRDRGQGGLNVVVRTSLPLEVFAKTLRAEIAQIEGSILIDDIRSLEQVVSASTARRRWQTLLLSLFAGVAALLAGLGIWGVVSYAVSQRRKEIGVRMALGGSAGSVVRLVVVQGLRPIALGALGGGVLSLVAARGLESQLFGIHAFDIPSFLGATALLIAVAATACVLPARRAATVDPAASLRVD